MEYFDKILQTLWYWQHLAQGIAKWHLSSVEALPSANFWKSEKGPISWTEWNSVMEFAYTLILTRCTPWDCQMAFKIGWVFAEVQILFKFKGYCKMTFIIGRGFAENQILKKWKWPYLLNWVECIDRLLCKHRYYQDLAKRLWNVIFHRSRFCRAPNSENVKMALSLELSGMKFCIHIGILTRCSPWDCQMTFGIGRSFAEVQILKKSENKLFIVWSILIKFCRQFDVEKI